MPLLPEFEQQAAAIMRQRVPPPPAPPPAKRSTPPRRSSRIRRSARSKHREKDDPGDVDHRGPLGGVIAPRRRSRRACARCWSSAGSACAILRASRCSRRILRTSRTATASASGLSGRVSRRDLVGEGRLSDDPKDHPADRLELGIVEGLGDVPRACGSSGFSPV